MKGVLIGAMSLMGLALVVILSFLWIRVLSKKERAAKRYTEVKKQVDPEASKKGGVSNFQSPIQLQKKKKEGNLLFFPLINANLIL